MSASKTTTTLSREQLEQLYRSNVRQRTRANLGVGISAFLGASGFFYMFGPAAVAYDGAEKSEAAREKLSEIMEAHGVRLRQRDKLAGALEGTAEKLTMSFLTLGHDEIAYLDENYELDPQVVQAHSEWLAKGGDGPVTDTAGNELADEDGCQRYDPGFIGEANILYNGPVNAIKEEFNVQDGRLENAEQVEGNVVAGTAAAGIEYVTNRAGHAWGKYRASVRR